jgi:hypothetical protein
MDAHFTSPIQQNAIKFLPTHLIGLRPVDLSNVSEVYVSATLTVMREEACTPFLRKTSRLDPLGHP